MALGSTQRLTDGFASASLATSSIDVPVPLRKGQMMVEEGKENLTATEQFYALAA
jgi:hypothetical protein